MKNDKVRNRVNRKGGEVARPVLSAGKDGVSIDPPNYGIDFLDSELSSGAALSGSAAAIQLKEAIGLGRKVLTANGAQAEKTGFLPNNLKAGIEHLSGLALDDVKVHYNSTEPARLQAIAFAQGTNIYLAPRQEKCLPHEAWHVVQQAQGRVQPTMQLQDGVPVNDDPGLEHEADAMGRKALAEQELLQGKSSPAQFEFEPGFAVVQRAGTKPNTASKDGKYRIKLSSARESFTYKNRAALGLEKVLPKYYGVAKHFTKPGEKSFWTGERESLVTRVLLKNGEFVELETPIPAPGGGKELLVIDSVGYEEEKRRGKAKMLFMDVKIGTYTKSGEQFELEGASKAWQLFKKIEHNLKDWNRKSRPLGYDIDAQNMEDFEEACAFGDAGKIREAMQKILPKLEAIQERMSEAPITFVGSSLLIAFNLDRPSNSDVKLIDPDHPIVLDDRKQQVKRIPKDVMTSAHFKPTPSRELEGPLGFDPLGPESGFTVPGRTYEDYIEKWQTSFSTGMNNFIEWFSYTMQGLSARSSSSTPAPMWQWNDRDLPWTYPDLRPRIRFPAAQF
jgi:hypothetical protein